MSTGSAVVTDEHRRKAAACIVDYLNDDDEGFDECLDAIAQALAEVEADGEEAAWQRFHSDGRKYKLDLYGFTTPEDLAIGAGPSETAVLKKQVAELQKVAMNHEERIADLERQVRPKW